MTAALRVEKLLKKYGELLAVDGLDLEVREGECFGLLGPTAPARPPRWRSSRPERTTAAASRCSECSGERRACAAPAARRLPSGDAPADRLTVEENLRMFRSFYQRGRPVEEVLDLVGLRRSVPPGRNASPAGRSSALPSPARW